MMHQLPLNCSCGACGLTLTLCEVIPVCARTDYRKVIFACNNIHCSVEYIHYYLGPDGGLDNV